MPSCSTRWDASIDMYEDIERSRSTFVIRQWLRGDPSGPCRVSASWRNKDDETIPTSLALSIVTYLGKNRWFHMTSNDLYEGKRTTVAAVSWKIVERDVILGKLCVSDANRRFTMRKPQNLLNLSSSKSKIKKRFVCFDDLTISWKLHVFNYYFQLNSEFFNSESIIFLQKPQSPQNHTFLEVESIDLTWWNDLWWSGIFQKMCRRDAWYGRQGKQGLIRQGLGGGGVNPPPPPN